MNKVILFGNVGSPPELKTYGETTIAGFSLATSRKVNGEDETSWHRIKAFGKVAAVIEQHVKQGDKLLVEGRISYGEYTDKAGVKKYSTDIVLERFEFGGQRQTTAPNDSDDNLPF